MNKLIIPKNVLLVTNQIFEELLATKPQNKELFESYVAGFAPDDDKKKQELETVEHKEEAGTTVFSRMSRKEILRIGRGHPSLHVIKDGDPEEKLVGLFDYTIKGFFKDACAAMNRFDEENRRVFFDTGESVSVPAEEEEDETASADKPKTEKDKEKVKKESSLKLAAYKQKIDGCIFVAPRFIPLMLPAGGEIGMCQRPLRAQTPQGERVSLVRSETVPEGTTLEYGLTILSKDLRPFVKAWLNYGQFRGLGQWRNSGKGKFFWEETGLAVPAQKAA